MSTLNPGATVSHFRVISQLGAGGMGEVYLAEDVTLARRVALKVLPPQPGNDKDRLRRFITEAKAASTLNHPNVAHIYEIGESDAVHFIAMELVEGKTLHAKIKEDGLKISDVVNIATQITDGLQAAHARGIIHRDLKPGNIMLTPENQVKVLDFGLARMIRTETVEESAMPTISRTEPGVVLGTVPYMSPEQALGKPVDARSDIFSLGSILYEMCAGRVPFSGNTSTELIEQIVHSQPVALARFNYDVPPELDRMIRKCLEKNPEERYQSAKDLLIDLRSFTRDTTSGTRAPQPARRFPIAFAVGIVVAIIAIAAFFYHFKPQTRAAIRSIAVLPFLNKSGNENLEYLSDGITESTINDLSQLSELRVIARPLFLAIRENHWIHKKLDKTCVWMESSPAAFRSVTAIWWSRQI